MYLKALELQGFKSFPEKTSLIFEKEITAIVGPNGSGKSNISDAILWVLGEQSSKTLRGGKMEDVIFGGTEKRGSVGFAQVSLILDNTEKIFGIDSDDFTITRRYYRSGESEYYINREAVRLKDITELLMDTGLGRDGYSIIGQGKISEIVSAKSADRRDVFEEAAGISRFRYRKEEAERKLARTEENLLRITDKLEELELQREPLMAQAETAKKYLLLRDDLRIIEISVWTENLDKLREQFAFASTEYDTAKSALKTAQSDLEALYRETENLSEKMREQDMASERGRSKLSEIETLSAECDSAIAVLRTLKTNNAESLTRINLELTELDGKSNSLDAQISERRGRINQIDAERAVIDADIRGLFKKSSDNDDKSQGAAQKISELAVSDSEIADEIAQNRTLLSVLAETSQELLDGESAGLSLRSELLERSKTAKTDMDSASAELAASREKCDELNNIISGYKIRLSGREGKAKTLSDTLTTLTIDAKNLDSRINMLREMEKDFEGFSKSVKTIMQEASRGALRGIHGPVANLVKTDDKFALAVETAIGGAMQNIVVDNQNTGKEAIELLKRRDAGRATFLPLDVIHGSSSLKLPEGEAGFVGSALSLCRYASVYSGVFASILGRTVVAETLPDAIRISKKLVSGLRVVTLDGQLINAGGSMTGGSAARNTGIISRANELKRLELQHGELEARLKLSAAQHQEAERELTAAKYELDVALGEYDQARSIQISREANAQKCKLEFAAAEQSLIDFEAEKTENARKIAETDEKISRLKLALRENEETQKNIAAELDAIGKGKAEFESERDRLSAEISSLREKSASLTAERGTTLSAADQLEAVMNGLSADSDSRKKALDELSGRESEIIAELSEKESRLEDYSVRAQTARDNLSQITAQKLELEGKRTVCEKTAQEKNRALFEMERDCSRLEQRKASNEMEEKQILDRLWDNYELSHSAAQALRQPVESLQKSNRQIAELRRDISALGTPNIGAIEEFDRVSERYDFLKAQHDDVISSKTELFNIITEITQEMKEIFLREFRVIDQCFRQTFLELFGGGKAALELDDETDVLNCGIEIKAQPPGKALSTISLMSGGEKAFVAIALYFAILKVRPTPFCVMDEIEAALDEANVIRFAEYMRSMSHSTQFIVITHRRGTMEEADMLYGVTMQERGVSKIISVDLQAQRK